MNPNDTRSLEVTFDQPTRIRIEHDGKTVYDQVHNGHTKLVLKDLGVPYNGTTVLFVDEEPVCEWEVG